MNYLRQELVEQLDAHESGISDLLTALELAEQAYFPAVEATSPYVRQPTASDSTKDFPDTH